MFDDSLYHDISWGIPDFTIASPDHSHDKHVDNRLFSVDIHKHYYEAPQPEPQPVTNHQMISPLKKPSDYGLTE